MELAPHILVVDDDQRIRELLQKYLQKQGFLVSAARDAAHARRLLAGLEFDLVVLDVMMPGENGLDLTRWIRSQNETPVLLLTAMGETDHRITGLEAGADDYLSKPFEPKELLLRLHAILRRSPTVPQAAFTPKQLSLGALTYDTERAELWQGDGLIRLTGTEAQLMRIFAARMGETVSRTELVDALGGAQGKSQERAIDVQITRLRRKIESDAKAPRYLQTIRGVGYMLMAD